MEPPAPASAPPPPPLRHAAAWSVAILLVAACVAALATWQGRQGRAFGRGEVVRTVDSPEQALLLWRAAGLRGRTLLLFGAYPHFNTSFEAWTRGAALSDSNWLELGIFENVVRHIYWIVPEDQWTAFRKAQATYGPIQPVPFLPGPTSLYTGSGVPLQAVTPATLPRLDEPALVFVDGDRFDPRDVAALLAAQAVRSDLTVVHRRRPPG